MRRIPTKRPKTVRCRRCKTKIKLKEKGPVPLYCGRNCRQRAYERRRYGGVMVMLAQDIATAKIRDVIRAEVIAVLTDARLLPEQLPPALLRPRKRPRPNLRLVDGTPPDEGPPPTVA